MARAPTAPLAATSTFEKIEALLKGLGARIESAIDPAFPTIGNNVQNNARILVTGPGRGRVYTWRGAREGEKPDGFRKIHGRWVPIVNRAVPHVASAPGDPPVVDTGDLRKSIEADVNRPEKRISLFAGGHEAPYAIYLELGTRYMAARPFLARSVRENPQAILDPLVKRIVGAIETLPGAKKL